MAAQSKRSRRAGASSSRATQGGALPQLLPLPSVAFQSARDARGELSEVEMLRAELARARQRESMALEREASALREKAMFEDALCATQQNGFDSDGGHALAVRLGGYFNRPEEERAAARAAIEDSFTVRSAQVSSRDAAVGKQFSQFRPSRQEVELFVVEPPVWLSLLGACESIDDRVVAVLAAELQTYRDALCFLDEISTRHLDEVSVVQPLVALWLEHLAEALFGEDALVSVRAEVEELTVKLPHSVVEISGDADRVVVVNGILGCVVEVKRPFDVFALRGSAAKDQLLIEVAGFADVNGRDVFTGMVTDLFRLNIALRNRSQETADGRWVVYECRRRFLDSDEFTRAVLVVLAVGFRELFPALDLGRIWASPVAETARALRLAKRQACKVEDLHRERDDKEDGGDSDDELPPPPGAGADSAQKRVKDGKATAAAAPPPASGPSGSKVRKRVDSSPQQENAVLPPPTPSVKYQLVRAEDYRQTYRKSLVDVATGATYAVVKASEDVLQELG